MIIQGYSANSLARISSRDKLESKNVSFSAAPPDKPTKYIVKEKNIIKKSLPRIAFATSIISAAGYLLGGFGLFYDLYNDKKKGIKEKTADGVKTVTANTQVGKIGMTCTKVGLTAASVANIACGLGEGIPLMALGEASNLGAAPIIETPVGTGLFGIGIASIFAGLALDNTPQKKLNEFDLMAKDSFKDKLKLIGTNIKDTSIEIGGSVKELIKNIYKPSFWKEDLLKVIPTTVVFSEAVDEKGSISIQRSLRHKKNYLMHAASFTLALGGVGIILSSIFKANKPQKASLKVEEAGFLFDNFGVTKYGLDRFTTNYKSSGTSFVVGGVLNAVSQFLGLDNKDGRALQWLGIAGVFLGYTFDRGRTLRKSIKDSIAREKLTRVVREWKVDLSTVIENKVELKKLLKELKAQAAAFEVGKEEIPPITNTRFNEFYYAFEKIASGEYKDAEVINKNLSEYFPDIMKNMTSEKCKDIEEAVTIVEKCSNKLFGEVREEYVEKAK